MRECVVLAETDQLDDVTSSMMKHVRDKVYYYEKEKYSLIRATI
jgi:hypothetical protein